MERDKEVIGHTGVKRCIDGFLSSRRLPHTLLFWGPPGVGKFTFALELASRLNGSRDRIFKNIYPDCLVFFPGFKGIEKNEIFSARREGRYYRLRDKQGNILIDDIREIKRVSTLTPYEGKYKVFIIVQAERMTFEAMNAFLKVLEEPGPNNLFILITPHYSFLPETVVSRATLFHFRALSEELLEEVLTRMGYQIEPDILKLSRGVEDYLFLQENVDLIEKVDKLFFNMSPFQRIKEWRGDFSVEEVLKALLFLFDRKREGFGLEERERFLAIVDRAFYFLRSNVKSENVLRYLLLEV